MVDNRRLSHRGEDGSTFSQRITDLGYELTSGAENIAQTMYRPSSTPRYHAETVMSMWLRSRGHKRNIIGDYDHIGLGYAISDNDYIYWCVVFANPAQENPHLL